MTNFANIKNMNIKQMAKFLATLNGGGTVREEQFLRWLKEKKGGEHVTHWMMLPPPPRTPKERGNG